MSNTFYRFNGNYSPSFLSISTPMSEGISLKSCVPFCGHLLSTFFRGDKRRKIA